MARQVLRQVRVAGSTKLRRWRQVAKALKREAYALYFAYRDPRVPWYARAFAACVVAYAFSPVDLIPDPIPFLGYLDDLVLIPLGVKIALALIPGEVMDESRAKAEELLGSKGLASRVGAAFIVALWLLGLGLAVALFLRLARG